MDIEALSFDLDDTLWAFAPAQARAEAALHAWLLARAPRTAKLLTGVGVLARYRQLTAAAHPGWSSRPDLVRRESIRAILAAAGADPSLAAPAYEAFWRARQCVDLYEDVLPSLRRLSGHYPLIAVTNGNSDLAATGVAEFFRGAVTARGIGAAKPEPRIFHAAAEALCVAPHRMLHVGDDLHLDVIGARAAGVRAAWLVRPAGSAPVPQAAASVPADLVVRSLHELCAALNLPPERGAKPISHEHVPAAGI
jgi:putative hydrolase of the HAD superfamily